MSGMLVDGTWRAKWTWEHDDSGDFKRQTSAFRAAIEDSPDATHPVETGRYRLYVSYACPWAHRTLLVRALAGLDEALPVTVVHPDMLDEGWELRDDDGTETPEPEVGATKLHQIYTAANRSFTGRVTVPILWDRVRRTIVNNESREIIRQLDRTLGRLGHREVNLHPEELLPRIDETLDAIYEPINNGVYRCGFAGSQDAYERAFRTLFAELDRWDAVLAKQRYLCGARLTAADVAMFTTLVRFDPVYYVHFKCNGKLIQQYENLSGYVRELYQIPGVRETVRMDHIKRHYYYSHSWLNPRRFVAAGPDLGWLDAPHGRERLEGAPIFG
jgi:glutathionyl-hydroquinone reductase